MRYALLACLATFASQAAEVRYTGPDAVAFVARESSTGTSLSRARVEAREVAKGSPLEGLAYFTNEAVGKCDAVKMVQFEPLPSPDTLGGTSTRLSGLGVYAAFSDNSTRGGGNLGVGQSFLAPYVSLKIRMEAADGSRADTDLVASAKAVTDPDRFSRSEFLAMDPQTTLDNVLVFAKPRIEKAVQDLAKGKCP
jgi:hypothetical protein